MTNKIYIHLAQSNTDTFETSQVKDLLFYSTDPQSKIMIGSSNTSNYVSIAASSTSINNDLVAAKDILPAVTKQSDIGSSGLRFNQAWIDSINVSNIAAGAAGVTTLQGSIVPSLNRGSDLGTSNLHFKEAWIDTVHISSNTLFLGDTPVLGTDADTINITADVGQGIHIKTSGDGQTKMTSSNGVIIKAEGSTNSSVVMDAVGTNAHVNITSDKGITMQAVKSVDVAATGPSSIIDFQSTGTGGTILFGATNQVTVTAPSMVVSSNMTVQGNTTVQGNLIVNGTEFTVNTQTVEVKDNIILLNSGQVGSGVSAGTAGISIDRGDEINYQILFDETDDRFKIGPQGSLSAIATQNYVNTVSLNTSNITSGTFADARIPNLDGSKITTGVTCTGNVVKIASPTLTGTTTVATLAGDSISTNGLVLNNSLANNDLNQITSASGVLNVSAEATVNIIADTNNNNFHNINLVSFRYGGVSGGTSVEKAKIDANGVIHGTGLLVDTGNVGIGTSVPNAKLHAVGRFPLKFGYDGTMLHTDINSVDGNIFLTARTESNLVPEPNFTLPSND